MKRSLAMMLALLMALCIVPTVAFAEAKTIYVDATNGNDTTGDGSETAPYKTVGKAAGEATSGSTIYLADGNYSTYTAEYQVNYGKKDLTFIGSNKEKVTWQIGAKNPDPTLEGTEYNGDYSFDSRGSGEHNYAIKFQNLTLMSAAKDYLGFIGADNTIVEDCIIVGKTFYWGYTSATFKNTTFNCPDGDYAIWTYSSPTMTFDNCIFNSSGKVINVYNEGGTPDVTVNFMDCIVNSTGDSSKSVLNINDSRVQSFVINISGKNTINGIKADGIKETEGSHKEYDKQQKDVTCSKLFEFNTKYDNANNNGKYANSGKTTVNIDGITVWKDGKMVKHAIDTKNDKYTDGYKDNAFDVTYSDWSAWNNDTRTRTFTKICKYCGYKEEGTEKETRTVEHHDHYYSAPTPVPVMVIPPKTGDMTIWQSILNFLGIK